MDKIQLTSPYHILFVVCVCLTLTSAIGDLAYMQPGPGGGMFVHDVSYDAPDTAYIASPFGAASPFGGSLVQSVDIGDSYYMPNLSPGFSSPSMMNPSRNVMQSYPSSRSSHPRGIVSRRYGGRRVRMYVV